MRKQQWIFRFLEWFCPPQLYEGIEGDLIEAFESDVEAYGEKEARRKLFWAALRFFRPEIILRNKFTLQLINTVMIGNYMKVAGRNIQKRKLYSFINAFGLSIGIAFCVLIFLFIQDEKSFDQFHSDKEHIHRIHTTNFVTEKYKKGDPDPYNSHPYLPAKLGEVMLDELAEVRSMTRFTNYNEGIMRYDGKNFKQKFACIDSGFFQMFSFNILLGDKRNPLKSISDAVLTPEVATKFFGDEDPINKTFTLEVQGEEKTMTVRAIIETPPANSSIVYEMLVAMDVQPWFTQSRDQWGNFSYPTFIQVQPGTDMTMFKIHLDTLTRKYMKDRFTKWRESQEMPDDVIPTQFNAVALPAIHLNKQINWDKVSDPQYSWILGGIALLILAIACINYISLALTTSASRRIEVGIRKVVGAQKGQVAWQFTFESLLLALVSMVIGLVLVVLFLPFFNEFTGKGISLSFENMLQVFGASLLITLLIGLFAGSYPSIFLSRFLPAHVLKGRFTSRVQAGFTKPLVVFQFFLSASMIICSVVMYRQMNFISTKDLGFDKEQVLVIPTQTGWNPKANQVFEQFRNALKDDNSVKSIAGVTSSFNKGWSRYGYNIKGENKQAFVYSVDTGYIPLLDIELTQGRNFDGTIVSDSSGVIVNEALVKDMNWKDPMSEHLNWQEDTVGLGAPVIGVMKDYNFQSLENEVQPMFLTLGNGYLTTILVKLTPENIPDKIDQMRKTWLKLFPDKPFEYTFMDEDVAAQYNMHTRWSKIMGLSTIFAIIIACLGLFGLAGINAINRTKEIGIRKVMGAPVGNIFVLLNKQYFWLAIIAFALAAPLSWYAMNKWLATFKFAITIGWELFAISMLVGLLVALLTVSYHAIKAALVNPAETLKYE